MTKKRKKFGKVHEQFSPLHDFLGGADAEITSESNGGGLESIAMCYKRLKKVSKAKAAKRLSKADIDQRNEVVR